MESLQQTNLIQVYHKHKSQKSNRLSAKSDKKSKKKSKHKKSTKSSTTKQTEDECLILSSTTNKALDDYLLIAIQHNSCLLNIPLQILEMILYDHFYPFQRYAFASVCKLFRYIIDDSLQCSLNNSINDHRIHNLRLNAYYFYNNFDSYVVRIKQSLIMDLSNEALRTFTAPQKQFVAYIFMYQSKLALLYKKELSLPKYKKYKKKAQRKKKQLQQQQQQHHKVKSHFEVLSDFVRVVSECTKVLCGGNAIWFHVSGMDIFGPILYSKYCQISSLSLDRDYINDEILLRFCKSLLFRNVLYSEISPWYNCKFLQRLDLSHNNSITDIGLNTLFAVIGEKCSMLQEIYLSNLASITNLTCKIIYKFYKLFGETTTLKLIVLNRNKFIDENGVNILNDLFKENIIDSSKNIRFFVAQCRIDKSLAYEHSWDGRIRLVMPERIR